MSKLLRAVCALGVAVVVGSAGWTGTAEAGNGWPPGTIHNLTGRVAYVADFWCWGAQEEHETAWMTCGGNHPTNLSAGGSTGPNHDMDAFAAPAGCVTEYQFLAPGLSEPAWATEDRRGHGTLWIRIHDGTAVWLQSMCGQ